MQRKRQQQQYKRSDMNPEQQQVLYWILDEYLIDQKIGITLFELTDIWPDMSQKLRRDIANLLRWVSESHQNRCNAETNAYALSGRVKVAWLLRNLEYQVRVYRREVEIYRTSYTYEDTIFINTFYSAFDQWVKSRNTLYRRTGYP